MRRGAALTGGLKPDSEELIVLVDELGRPIGEAGKWASHHSETPLHLAFSCYLFDGEGRLLITQRAPNKLVWPGVWTNSACGHPSPGESMEAAIKRRLEYELGMGAGDLEIALPDYRYRSPAFGGVVENEFCPVYFARTSDEPRPNHQEVQAYRWIAWSEFARAAGADGENMFSWWCKDQLLHLRDHPSIPVYTRPLDRRRGRSL